METQAEFSPDESWATRVARLMDLLSLEIRAVQRHTEGESPQIIIEQYEKLRDRRLAELRELMRGRGLTVQLDSTQGREAA